MYDAQAAADDHFQELTDLAYSAEESRIEHEREEAQIAVLRGRVCPYCGNEPELVNSTEVYGPGHDYGNLMACLDCDAYVGTHGGKRKPLGRLADRRLRIWKKRAHAAFDPLWKKGDMTRSKAYRWLSERLDIDPEWCHIGMFGMRYCKKVVAVCRQQHCS